MVCSRRVETAVSFFQTYKGAGPPPPVEVALQGVVLDAMSASIVVALHVVQWCDLVSNAYLTEDDNAHAMCAREKQLLTALGVQHTISPGDHSDSYAPPHDLWLPPAKEAE